MSLQHLGDDDPVRRDRAVALAALALTGERADECPALEDIAAWHAQRLDTARAHEVETHVAACDRCFELWRGLLAVDAADPRHARAARDPGWAPFAWLRQPAWLGAAAGLAAIAIAGLYVTLRVPGTFGPPLPAYELSLQGRAILRGSAPAPADAPVAFETGTRFELMLRPERAVGEDVQARVWYTRGDETRELSAAPTVAARGVVVISGRIGEEWTLPAGDADLLVVVGRAQALPDAATLARELREARTLEKNDWVAWRIPVRVGD